MKVLFSKYLRSVCTPEEFEKLINWLNKKDNESIIPDLIQPFWKHYMYERSPHPINAELREKIKEVIKDKELISHKKRTTLYTWSIRIAALFIIGLLLNTFLLHRKFHNNFSSLGIQTVSVPYGATSNFSLPDGSQVWLNSGSSLEINLTPEKSRSLILVGEAYFEVSKSNIPFIVSTPLGTVQALGTAFNVIAFPEDNKFITSLAEGSILVTENISGTSKILQPGQQSKLENSSLQVENVDLLLCTSWKEGRIIFRNEPLPDAAKRLERWYNVKIELDNDDVRLSSICYTGTLEMESISEVLALLKRTAPINIIYNEETRIVRITYR